MATYNRNIVGVLPSSGALGVVVNVSTDGTLKLSGTLIADVYTGAIPILIHATLPLIGIVTSTVATTCEGILGLVGNLTKQFDFLVCTGVLKLTGDLTTSIRAIVITGTLKLTGEVNRAITYTTSGTLKLIGGLTQVVKLAISGILRLIGVVKKHLPGRFDSIMVGEMIDELKINPVFSDLTETEQIAVLNAIQQDICDMYNSTSKMDYSFNTLHWANLIS
jgi:hypothetical protein